MFKFIGIILIFSSCILLFNKNTIINYTTYTLFTETIEIAELIKLKCGTGITYRQIFNEINFSDYVYYKSSDYKNISLNCYADDKRLLQINTFFKNLGKRNMDLELAFIQNNIDLFRIEAERFRNKYEKNRQSDIITGLSLAVIISIVLI